MVWVLGLYMGGDMTSICALPTAAPNQFLKLKLMINKVSMYEDKLKRKEEDVNRLVEENNNYETISKSHKEINGKLQTRVNELEEDNKKLSKQIEDKDKHIKQLVDVM